MKSLPAAKLVTVASCHTQSAYPIQTDYSSVLNYHCCETGDNFIQVSRENHYDLQFGKILG